MNPGRHLSAYLIPMLIFQTVVCVFAVIKSIRMAAAEYQTPKVMTVLLRDSATYFGSILAVLVVNIVIFSAARVRQSFSRFITDQYSLLLGAVLAGRRCVRVCSFPCITTMFEQEHVAL